MAAASLEDWFAIHNVFIRYATSLDHGDVEAVVDCFANDALLESPVQGTFCGHDGIRDFAERTARLKREQGVQFRHVVSNLVADVDGDWRSLAATCSTSGPAMARRRCCRRASTNASCARPDDGRSYAGQ
jgi:ketosteroid isomerase-like protein